MCKLSLPFPGIDEVDRRTVTVTFFNDHDGDRQQSGHDCDDRDARRYFGAVEIPDNGIDEDCDGRDADFPAVTSDIVHGERGAGRYTTIRRLRVIEPPAGSTVSLRCTGKRCRFRTRTVRPVPGTRTLSLVRHFRRVKLAPGTRVEVAVRAPEAYGKMLRLTTRNGAGPKVSWRKIDPVTGAVTAW